MNHPLATPLTGLLGSLKIDQIAFCVRTDEEELAVKRQFGLEDANWVEDEVLAFGTVGIQIDIPTMSRNRAKLLFNYDLGIELEILRYVGGPNYCDVLGVEGMRMCHIGMHLDKGAERPDLGALAALFANAPVIQQVETREHTNQFLVETGRRYRYTIYDTTAVLGVCLKVIERIEKE